MFGSQLIFGLLVAVGDQAVEEAAGSALRVFVVLLSGFYLLVEVASSLLIDIIGLVEVGCEQSQRMESAARTRWNIRSLSCMLRFLRSLALMFSIAKVCG